MKEYNRLLCSPEMLNMTSENRNEEIEEDELIINGYDLESNITSGKYFERCLEEIRNIDDSNAK